MLQNINRESVEIMIALFVTAGSAGATLGYSAATYPDVIGRYGTLGMMGFVLFSITTGRVTEKLVRAGEIPRTRIIVNAPNNAATGLYAIALLVIMIGLSVEVVIGPLNPVSLVFFIGGGAFCFQRAFRRGTEAADTSTA